MVNLLTADKALKTVYLGVVTEQLNVGVNPLLAKMAQTTSDVWGKDIVKLASYGVNGGVGAGDETGDLPTAFGNNYAQFKLELKNLYGSIEISDKAIRASENSAGAFVNLLNAEMEGLLQASKFNLGRMLYGDGSGKIAAVSTASATAKDTVIVTDCRNLIEGMAVDYRKADNTVLTTAARIISIDRMNKSVKLSKSISVQAVGDYLTVQNSYGKELTGLGAIFSDNDLYGLSRNSNMWMKPHVFKNTGAIDSVKIQKAIDNVEEVAGSSIDIIVTSYASKRAYIEFLSNNRMNMDYMNLDGGYKALSYNGIPVVSDRFVADGDMYLLNSSDFKLHQLCDWRWIEGEGGNVIKQKQGSPSYSATLVKYADMICDKPIGQALITGITVQ